MLLHVPDRLISKFIVVRAASRAPGASQPLPEGFGLRARVPALVGLGADPNQAADEADVEAANFALQPYVA